MNPHHLRTFLAVEKHRNYTRAAQELFLSQPAVSRHIRGLETELGVRLFERIGKVISLTDAGRTLACEARTLLGDFERVAEAVAAHRGADRGTLRIGASTTPGLYFLPPLLGRFHRSFPAVDIWYTIDNSLRVEEAVLRNELDLGFVGVELSRPELRSETIARDEIVFFTGAEHPLARKRVSLRRLGEEIWIVREEGSATQRLVETCLAERGFEIGRSLAMSSPDGAKAIVAGGIGISFLSLHGLREDLACGRLARVHVRGMRIRRPLHVVRHADKHVSPIMAAFLEVVRAAR